MSGEQQQQQQQQSAEPSQNAIVAAAGRFKDVVGNLLKEVRSCLLDLAAMITYRSSYATCLFTYINGHVTQVHELGASLAMNISSF